MIDPDNEKADNSSEFVSQQPRSDFAGEAEIDAAIAEIANDAEYQESAIRMVREFGG